MRLKRKQTGFTLIELLIVIGILATLAAVAIPTYARFFGQGEVEANQTELSNVQAAMDAMLAQNGIETDKALSGPGTNDFTALPVGITTLPEALYPEFLRIGYPENPTKCRYTWNDIGKLVQQSCP